MSKLTASEIATEFYLATDLDVTKTTEHDGCVILTIDGTRRFAISDEMDDDGETQWGYSWATYETCTEHYADGEIKSVEWELMSQDGGQDEAEVRKALTDWAATR